MDDYIYEEDEWDREQLLEPQWQNLQKKSFIKWCNSILRRAGVQVKDIENDFRDGVKLLILLELLTGKKLPKPDRGRMKLHKIANVNKALDFLAGKTIQLVSISAEAIVDGNIQATMGLIWIIILSQLIDDISYEDQEGKKGLLLWSKSVLSSYENLKVENFDRSFRDGLVFCAMVNAFRPGLIDYRALYKVPSTKAETKIGHAKTERGRFGEAKEYETNEKTENREKRDMYSADDFGYRSEQRDEVPGKRFDTVAEVSGRRKAIERTGLPLKHESTDKGSAEYFELHCDPCYYENEVYIEATGFCKNCGEHFCESCLRVHRKTKMSRDHVIVKSKRCNY